MFHGTDDIDFDLAQENPSSGGFDVCTTDDQNIAAVYAERFCGDLIIEFEFTCDAVVADEAATLAALGFNEIEIELMSPSDKFHAVDCSLDTLREAGFDAVEYTDQLPGTSEKFLTTRIIKPVIKECDRFTI